MNLILDPTSVSPELSLRSSMPMGKTRTCAVCGKTKLDQMFRHIPDMCDRCFSERDDMIRDAVERLYAQKAHMARDVKRVITQAGQPGRAEDDIPAYRDEDIRLSDLVMAEW